MGWVSSDSGSGSVPPVASGPSWLQRVGIFVRHAARILFLPFPGYTFDDLAACQDALDGPAFRAIAARMHADPAGRELMARQPEITAENLDFDSLRALPEGTLGHELWRHYHDNGLIEHIRAFKLGPPVMAWEPDTEYAKRRYRQTHDCRHVLLGVGIEGYEEVVLNCFQWAQHPQILPAAITIGGTLKHGWKDGKWAELRRMLPAAWRAGRRARLLVTVEFEQHWHRPLAELRAELAVDPVGDRYPRRKNGQRP